MDYPNVYGLYRIKNEQKYIERSLQSVINVCSKVIIFDDHSNDKTKEICESFGDKIDFVPSPFAIDAPTNEVRDKNYLLKYAFETHGEPDWVLCIDGDEELSPKGDQILIKLLTRFNNSPNTPNVVYFKFLYIWNSNMDIRVDGLYNRFVSPRLWKMPKGTQCFFKEYAAKSGFHCGWVPEGVPDDAVKYKSRVQFLHWGNASNSLRLDKYVWYNMKDPNNFYEDRYRHIVGAGPGYAHAGEEIQLYPLQAMLEDV